MCYCAWSKHVLRPLNPRGNIILKSEEAQQRVDMFWENYQFKTLKTCLLWIDILNINQQQLKVSIRISNNCYALWRLNSNVTDGFQALQLLGSSLNLICHHGNLAPGQERSNPKHEVLLEIIFPRIAVLLRAQKWSEKMKGLLHASVFSRMWPIFENLSSSIGFANNVKVIDSFVTFFKVRILLNQP